MMCKCINIEMGSYDRQTDMEPPYSDKMVSIDTCLVQEIAELRAKGIRTTGCCCGHNLGVGGYIGVEEEYIPKMLELGYTIRPNETDPKRQDSFYPMYC